jgi:hypothetical protein
MNEVRFPEEGLSADYGDIILDSVSDGVEAIISIDGVEILHETFSPDTSGMVYIRDIGPLAMMYDHIRDISLDNGLDGESVVLDILLREGSDEIGKQVRIYRSDAESGGTLSFRRLVWMPLSRVTDKITGPDSTEFLSFYGTERVWADVVYADYASGTDMNTTIPVGTIIPEDGNYYRYDVSPSRIAELCSIAQEDLISYVIYKRAKDYVRFTMDHRPRQNKTTFIFRNSFGAQEAFTCTGDVSSERKWTRNFGNISRRQRLISRDMANTITVNTGYIDEETSGLIEDLLNSQSVRILEYGLLWEVSIVEESFKVVSRRDELNAIEFKYRYSSNNQMQYRGRMPSIQVLPVTSLFDAEGNVIE